MSTKAAGPAGETTVSGGAIDTILKLAGDAKTPPTLSISVGGLAKGLPSAFPVVFNPHSERYESVKQLAEEWRTAPERRRGTAKVLTLGAFVDLVNRHKDADSAIFAKATWPNPSLTAVIDYHKADEAHEPRHLGHRVVYAFPVTRELKAWIDGDANTMKQAEFAAFLEEHAAELAVAESVDKSAYEPIFKERFAQPNELITLSRELEVFVGARVKRQERLATGERVLQFESENRTANGDKVDIPGIFMVQIKAFEQSEEIVRIPARLRYRVTGGDIIWFYQLYRWETFLGERVREDLAIAVEKTGLPAFEGEPEST